MSTPLELQQQIRQTTEEYYEQMQRLTRELALSVRETQEGNLSLDFHALSARGRSRPLNNRILKHADSNLQRTYLALLCMVAQSAPEMEDGWLLIQRIACGVGVDSLEGAVTTALSMKDEDLERLSRQFAAHDLRDAFLLDAMLVRLACPAPSDKTLELLTDFIALTGCGEEDVRLLSRLAVVLARQDGKAYLDMGLELGDRNWLGLEYIQKSAGILYTDQIDQAIKHGFQRVILHDCVADLDNKLPHNDNKQLHNDVVITECFLKNCTFSTKKRYRIINSTMDQCSLRLIDDAIGKIFFHFDDITLYHVKHRECSVEFKDFTYGSGKIQFAETPEEGLNITYVK